MCCVISFITNAHFSWQASYFKVAHNVLSGGFGELLTALHSEVQRWVSCTRTDSCMRDDSRMRAMQRSCSTSDLCCNVAFPITRIHQVLVANGSSIRVAPPLAGRVVGSSVTIPIAMECLLPLGYSYHVAHEAEMEAMAAETQELELQFPNLCIPDPDPTGIHSNHCLSTVGHLSSCIKSTFIT